MEKTYHPHSIENHWYPLWEKAGYFAPSQEGQPYCIMLPPPNVTGSLHMGHGFQQTLMDALIRYHRMCGDNTLWQPGTDHASIATQMIVERQLLKEGKTTRQALGRDAFLERVWEWKNQSGQQITRQMRRLGTSPDWSRECFTMDADLSSAVTEAFVRLHDEGLIYRGKRLVNWDPKLLTAVSDLEVISKEEAGFLWHIRYPLTNGSGFMTIATTRPETLLGDVAVAVHPEDKRYQKLIGQTLRLPLTDREIPIIADESVDPEFGSGCVKITPGHDFNDYAVAKRHDLPLINIFTIHAQMNDEVPKAYQGLDRFVARKQVIKELDTAGLLEKTVEHKLNVPRGERSGEIIEPYLTDQWYVKVESLAKPAIAAVEKGEIRFVPDNWSKIYFQWMNNLEDWCISRQLWWGHRIPAWYDDKGNIYVGMDENEIRQKYQLNPSVFLKQDDDVLDTWFSASLWPFSTLGWPEKTIDLETFYPSSVLITGFDIIFFWVARMIMMGIKFVGDVPFKEVYITGLIRDAEGHKMSKTKGNVLDPLDLIDGIELETLVKKRIDGLVQPTMAKKIERETRAEFPQGIAAFGTDALRFTFCALASTGRDIRFDLGRIEGYRNFCNKLWNAARYVLMHAESTVPEAKTVELSLADRWIVSRLQETIVEVRQHFAHYRFDLLAQTLYQFTWNEYCDWYLELSKPILLSESSTDAQKQGARNTLVFVLETLLRLMHPLMPFITEEIWQRVAPLAGKKGETIMLQAYPDVEKNRIDKESLLEVEWLKSVIIGIRTLRSEMRISPAVALPLLLRKGTNIDRDFVAKNEQYLVTLTKLSSIRWISDNEALPLSATALAGEMEILIPMAGFIDRDAECLRLQKEIEQLKKERDRSQVKLNNPDYVEKAPAAVVSKERERVVEIESALVKLEHQLEKTRG